MQKTKFKKFLDLIYLIINPIVSDTWTKRSILIISLLFGFYFTNSLISYLLDKPINTIFLAITIVLIMEVIIRSTRLSNFNKLSTIFNAIDNFRIGSSYALILEAFKLGS
tara:strand:+ start:1056 stop:1385 length:330 start_codon:yes stop_codon:yes gene_type:complete